MDAAAEAMLARRLDLQERQRQASALLDTLWLQSQQLRWQRECEFSRI